MEKEVVNKILLGRLLGQVYRVQKQLGCLGTSERLGGDAEYDEHIEELCGGFEPAIDWELSNMNTVSTQEYEKVCALLMRYDDEERLEELKGYYTIEDEVDQILGGRKMRTKAIKIFRYMNTWDLYPDVLKKLTDKDSESPSEIKSMFRKQVTL
jgi:hypothetical protein